jgi:ribosomal protein L18E
MLKFIEKELQKTHSENVELKKEIEGYKKAIENLSATFQKEIQATKLKSSKQETTDRLINEKLQLKVKQFEIDLGELDYLRKENKTLKDLLRGKK